MNEQRLFNERHVSLVPNFELSSRRASQSSRSLACKARVKIVERVCRVEINVMKYILISARLVVALMLILSLSAREGKNTYEEFYCTIIIRARYRLFLRRAFIVA